MDKYIKMLLIKLSQTHKVTINHTMGYNGERITNVFRITIKQNGKTIYSDSVFTKREVVSELMKWVPNKQGKPSAKG